MSDLDEGSDRSAEERGDLDVRSKAVEQIVRKTALDVPGIVRHTSGLGRVIGSGLPAARVTYGGSLAWVALDVAAEWPCHAESLAATVRDKVLDEANRMTGLDIDRVDVTIHVVSPSDGRSRRVE